MFLIRCFFCFNYYAFDSHNKVAEMIAYGQVLKKGDKSCTNKLEIAEYIREKLKKENQIEIPVKLW